MMEMGEVMGEFEGEDNNLLKKDFLLNNKHKT